MFVTFGRVQLLINLYTVSKVKMDQFQMKVVEEVAFLLFIMYRFKQSRVLVKVSMVHFMMHCNWSTLLTRINRLQ